MNNPLDQSEHFSSTTWLIIVIAIGYHTAPMTEQEKALKVKIYQLTDELQYLLSAINKKLTALSKALQEHKDFQERHKQKS